jgi:HSP20 family molecular chaperone IbpA
MFEKKICPNCGEKAKDDWQFCPYCGIEIEGERMMPIRSIFDDIDKEFESIDKMPVDPFSFPEFKMKPGMKGKGISIIIHGSPGMEPKIEVKASDEYKQLEPGLKRKLGVRSGIENEEVEKKTRKMPKITEEPETEIRTVANNQIISIKLPGVKSEKDIETKRLEQSIEVKAFAGNKAYFKLIPIPREASVNKDFKNGVLRLEIER